MFKVYYCYVGELCAREKVFPCFSSYVEWVRKASPVLRAWGRTWDIFQARMWRSRSNILPRLQTCEGYQVRGIIEKFLAENNLEW